MSKKSGQTDDEEIWDHGQAETGAIHTLALAFNGYQIRAKKSLLLKIL